MFKGIDITGYPPFKFAELGISRCFQDIGIFPSFSIAKIIMSGARIWARNSKFVTLISEQFITSMAGMNFSKKELELRRKAEEIIFILKIDLKLLSTNRQGLIFYFDGFLELEKS